MRVGSRRRMLATTGGLAVVAVFGQAGGGVVTTPAAVPAPQLSGETLAQFALEQPEAALVHRHLPLAMLKDALEPDKEQAYGPAQQDYADRAFPRTTISDAQARGARRAFDKLARNSRTDGSTPTTSTSNATSNSTFTATGGTWSPLGPLTNDVPGLVTYTGTPSTNSGRATALAVVPGCNASACTVYLGTAGGGVWRTDNGLSNSPTWSFVSAGIPSGSIGSLFYDVPRHTLYVGTGEQNGGGDSEAGVGLYRTADGGAHWSLVANSDVAALSRGIGGLTVSSNGTVYMGTDVARHGVSAVYSGRRTPPDAAPLGLFRLAPGTTTFTKIFSLPGNTVPPSTGQDYFQGGVNNVQLDPRDENTVYVALYGYGIWRSSSRLDGTSAFKRVFATAHPKDLFGDRTEFALTVKNGKTRIYAGDENDEKFLSWLWRTDNADVAASKLSDSNGNGGWTNLSNPGNGQPGFDSYNFCEAQCGYDMFVVTPPGHPDTVYIGGSMNYDEIFGTVPPRSNGRAVLRSVTAGVSFTDMTVGTNGVGMHPDQHALAFVPGQQDQFFEASDGGVIRVDGAASVDASGTCAARHLNGYDLQDCLRWLKAVPTAVRPLNQGLQTLQFQSVSSYVDGGIRHYLGGTQDNGTWAFGGSDTGYETVGGDGGQSATDSGNSGVHFHTYYDSFADVNSAPATAQYGAGLDPDHWNYISQPQDSSGERTSFYVPLIAAPSIPGTVYTGLQHVWRTTDDGGDPAWLDSHCSETDPARFDPTVVCGDFQSIGADLTSPSFGDRSGFYIAAIAVAPSNPDVMWVATRGARLFVSTNARAAAKDVTFTRIDTSDGGKTHLTPERFISGIAVDPADPMHAFVSFSGYSAYFAGGHVYDLRFDPSGGAAAATDLSGDPSAAGGIGDMPVTGLVYDDARRVLYAATDFGVLTAPATGGNSWSALGSGLPAVAVYGLTLYGDQLVAATHGRGAWTLTLT
ncbi:MAG: hypothetical protein JWO37_425 [Acidimicrobiales bacterium]|jgi:hypothetical protein|nr:hypothetical protein [Acidimicrobiales bacterium]